jgi:hypothetical protein
MTDLQKLEQTLKEIGCKFEIVNMVNKDIYQPPAANNSDQLIRLYSGKGYPGFYTNFYFLNGKFQGHGCRE